MKGFIMNQSIIPLKEAADRFSVENIDTFRRGMKKSGCIITIAGVDLIDMDKLQQAAVEKSQSKSNTQRVKRTANPIGLLRARVNTYPRWLEGKKSAIESAKITMAAAPNPYEINQGQKKLNSLQHDLKRMEGNFMSDQDKLNNILNADYTQESSTNSSVEG